MDINELQLVVPSRENENNNHSVSREQAGKCGAAAGAGQGTPEPRPLSTAGFFTALVHSWTAAPQQKAFFVGTVPCCSPLPGRVIPLARSSRKHSSSALPTQAVTAHGIADTGLAEQMLGSGCYKQLTQIHKLGKSFTCPRPDFVQKGWVLQCSHCLWPTAAPRARSFCGSGWMEGLWGTLTSLCFQKKASQPRCRECHSLQF